MFKKISIGIFVPGLVLALVFAWLSFRGSDWRAIVEIFRLHFDVVPFLAALALYGAFFVLKAMRWQTILGHSRQPSAIALIPYVFVGYAGNLLLPMQIGEAVRALLWSRKHAAGKTETLSGIALEKVLDVLMLILILEVASGLHILSIPDIANTHYWVTLFILLTLLGLILLVAFERQLVGWFETRVKNAAQQGISQKVLSIFLEALKALKSLKKAPVSLFLLSGAMWASMLFSLWLCMKAVGLDTSVPIATAVMFATVLGLWLPTAPGYIGTIQMAFVVVLLPLGTEREVILTASLLYNFLITVPPLLVTLFCLNTVLQKQSGLV